MLQNPKVNIQLRCIQLGEAMTHQMPKFGAFRLNNEKRTLQQYKIQDPPNNRKRKDKVMDLTQLLCQEVQIHDNKVALEVMHRPKHDGDDALYYVAAVYICKQFTIPDITSFVERLQWRFTFNETFQRIKKWHQQKEDDELAVETKVISVSLTCKVTMLPLKTPVRG